MEAWQAIETYMERTVDFVNEVRITNHGDGVINIDHITWYIQEKSKPTQEEFDALLAQPYLVKIYIGPNGFIWNHCKPFESLETDYASVIIECPFDILPECVEPTYGLPYRRYQDGTVHEVTDPTEYMVDPVIWARFQKKMKDEMYVLLRTKTNSEMKAIFDESPPYKQEIIYNSIHYFWSDMVPQWDFNLAAEIMLRYFTEFFFITQVQQTTLTEGQQAAFNSMITEMHNHSDMLKNNPFDPNGEILDVANWPNGYIPQMLNKVDYLRSQAIPQRIFICGR